LLAPTGRRAPDTPQRREHAAHDARQRRAARGRPFEADLCRADRLEQRQTVALHLVALAGRQKDVAGFAGVAPLAAALPAPNLLPLASLQRFYAGVVGRHPQLLAGGSHINMDEAALVRQLLLRSVSRAGPLAASKFVITNSCTEAPALCLRAVTSPGDTVAVESPACYLTLQLPETLGLKALEIPTDPSRGLSVDALDLATRDSRVAACLLVANASNPLGNIMPDENKRRLARPTAERNVTGIEDDIYGDLYFGSERPRPIKAFDPSGNVMLCSSFSNSPSRPCGSASSPVVAAGRRSPC